MTKVSVIKWSQNCTRTIRSGVAGIPKYLKNTCKAGYFNIFGCAKKTTSEDSSSILRPLYNRYFCHITIEKQSQIGTSTIRNGLQGYSVFGLFYYCNPHCKFNCKFRQWRSWAIMLKFFVTDQCTKRHNKNCKPACFDVLDKNWHALLDIHRQGDLLRSIDKIYWVWWEAEQWKFLCI